jgi:hypothetical protein
MNRQDKNRTTRQPKKDRITKGKENLMEWSVMVKEGAFLYRVINNARPKAKRGKEMMRARV